MPTPSARPDNEMIFNDIPVKYIKTIAKTTLSGIEHAITRVGLISFKNRIRISTARIAPTIIFSMTDSTMVSM